MNPGPPAWEAEANSEYEFAFSQEVFPDVELKDLDVWEKWCRSRGTSAVTCRDYKIYLLKPLNPNNRWSAKAYKLYYKYKCSKGENAYCEAYRKLRTPSASADLKVPSLSEVKHTLEEAKEPYRTVYQVLVESGVRLVEAVKLVNNYPMLECTKLNGFQRCLLGYTRGKKQALWAYIVNQPEPKQITAQAVTQYAKKHKDITSPKYIRKFVATKMAELDIPPHIIDFIEGRAAKSTLLQHYAQLLGQADRWYSHYARWLKEVGLV